MICKHIKFDRYAERLNADGRCDIWNWHCDKQLQSICKVLRDERAEQNIQIHELKLELEFCDEVESGVKPFEIRFNDRNYKKSDLIRYIPVLNGNPTKHTISNNTYEITYVLSGYGLMEGYVAFGQKELKEILKETKENE